jgi:hypothetical protein
LLPRSLRHHEWLNNVDQTGNLDTGASAPDGIRRQVVGQLGVLVGRKEQRRLNQQAQAPAVACALVAGRCGQRAPAVRRLPVLATRVDEPPQRLARDHLERAPGEVCRDQLAGGVVARVFQRHDEPCGLRGTDV